MMKELLARLSLLGAVMLMSAGCNPRIDASVATFNAEATKVASAGGQIAGTLAATQVPTPPAVVTTYDLSADPSGLLIHVWAQVYTLPSKSNFTIIATQAQVGDYIVQNYQLAGFQNAVKGGSVAIGNGQLRLDLSVVDTAGVSGTFTITFQPTLDSGGRLKLNTIGTDYGTLKLPDGMLSTTGDTVNKALTGAANDSLSKVIVQSLTLENGTLKVSGTLK
jgi:hypothetical protein